MIRRFRFKIKGEWTDWYTDADDLSFLHNNKDVQAMETVEDVRKENIKRNRNAAMTNEELIQKLDDLDILLQEEEGLGSGSASRVLLAEIISALSAKDVTD